MRFIAGCGVEFVHWFPGVESTTFKVGDCLSKKPLECRFLTPRLAVTSELESLAKEFKGNGPGPRVSGRLRRILTAFRRNKIEVWDQLLLLKTQDFREWDGYGEKSHRELVLIAKENGYIIAGWE